MKKGLNEKQKMFCLEYLKDFNASRAYRKVYGGTDKTCRTNGCKLLTNANIQQYLGAKAEKKVEKVGVGVDYVLDKLHQIVEIGMGEQAVEKNGKTQKILDLANANSALEKLGKYHKMYTDKVEQDTSLQIEIVSFKDKEEGQD